MDSEGTRTLDFKCSDRVRCDVGVSPPATALIFSSLAIPLTPAHALDARSAFHFSA